MAEHCVQTMKASLIKTIEEGEDVDLALLTYKTTLLNYRLPSPAELLNSRKYKTLLPTRIVPTRLQESYRQIMDQGKQLQAQLYNKNTRVLPRLQQSQKVVVQLDPDKTIWTPAQIIQCPINKGRPCSLRTIHGGVYTRNRIFIKPDLINNNNIYSQIANMRYGCTIYMTLQDHQYICHAWQRQPPFPVNLHDLASL